MLAPVDRSIIYAAKLISNLILMFALALVVTPVAVLLFGFDLSAAPWGFAIIMSVSFIGFAAVGTLFAAAVSSSRLQGVLAMLIFPVCLPLVKISTEMTTALYRDGDPLNMSHLMFLVAFDVIFLVISWLVFEIILEPQ